MKKLVIILALVIGLGFIASPQATSLTGDDFEAGNLIETATLTDKDAMSVAQIQSFLESRVNGGQCDRDRTSYSSNYSPPWTCLFEFEENPDTGVNNYGQFEEDGSPQSVSAGKSAAAIIWQAGQDHDINPQVLLALMQVKQRLVTDNWPWTNQFSKAAGYPCSASLPCPLAEATLARQLDGAAKLLRYYLDNLDSYWYGLGENEILYNHNPACGQQTVDIVNEATVALYLYTPYTPNQAALDNLYGYGDECSTYGNRNFWRYFNDWFGESSVPTDSPAEPTADPDDEPPPTVDEEPAVVAEPIPLTGDDFEAGNLIETATLTDKDAMSVAQIQSFLESRVNGGQCDRDRTSYSSNYSPPWTCLFEFEENPDTGVNNYGQFEEDGSPQSVSAGKSAAAIIWQAGQDHDINPQVLLVLLQKEQSLVTDNWPWIVQFNYATGYRCPDSTGCDENHGKFYIQVDGAARLFRGYLDNLDSYWYGIGENQILYHPDTECGQQTVDIVNEATVALYLYTPYTPNQAALDNLYGYGDECSTYGNRNFWRYFNDWFGESSVPTDSPAEPTADPDDEPPPTVDEEPAVVAEPIPLTGDDFEAGNLIETATLTDKDAMSVAQIQSFLESRVNGGQCDRDRTSYSSNYSPPWTCLFEFEENPDTGVNNYGQFEEDGSPQSVSAGKSAAAIIWQAGQDHDINPQVLLALMQVKQRLVTDNWPWTNQFSKAAGYPCSASLPCPLAEATLARQLDGAAKLLRYYLDNLDSYWYGLGENEILYNHNPACGQQTVDIVNEATVALYLYTPYTPNQAALDNLYGLGDSCSNYDNRNFWRYFNDWFGEPVVVDEEPVVEEPAVVAEPIPLTGDDFEAGNLIETATLTDKDAMSVAQIQSFLESRVNGGQCDRDRTSYSSNYSPPWTCLFEFEENPDTGVNNYGQFEEDGSPQSVSAGKSAAAIIWQAGQDHDINPQVLLALMQVKQRLVTDNWPWTNQFSKAAGYPCSASLPCPLAEATLARQLDGAAKLLRYYLDNLDSYWYGLGENEILYNHNPACGQQTVDIVNEATVALYLYTPYTPNQAALDNLYGLGDSCSNYDNRNFWRYFNDWFGEP